MWRGDTVCRGGDERVGRERNRGSKDNNSGRRCENIGFHCYLVDIRTNGTGMPTRLWSIDVRSFIDALLRLLWTFRSNSFEIGLYIILFTNDHSCTVCLSKRETSKQSNSR